MIRPADPAGFLALAQDWLLQAEAENNVALGVVRELALGALAPQEPPYLAVARDGSIIVGCAVRTAPQALIVTRCTAAARRALAEDALAVSDPPGVWGPVPDVDAFALELSTLSGGALRPLTRQRLYVAAAVTAGLRQPCGVLRRVRADERALALQWLRAFVEELSFDGSIDPSERIDRLLRSESLYFWDDGGPVAMLGVGGRTAHSARVSLVYTPPVARKRGYAGAAVAGLTTRLLHEGCCYCCIYTDLANPTSNRIYQEVGYRMVCDFAHYVSSV